jgi:hypothetical protein
VALEKYRKYRKHRKSARHGSASNMSASHPIGVFAESSALAARRAAA